MTDIRIRQNDIAAPTKGLRHFDNPCPCKTLESRCNRGNAQCQAAGGEHFKTCIPSVRHDLRRVCGNHKFPDAALPRMPKIPEILD